ncbi:MAG: cytochrome c, partial [Anaerolineae bacterium]|nr:cytochrome c [Anaerolineae bacterium]
GEPATAPLPATDNSLARGQTLFGIYCSVCHGPQGGGDGPLGRDSYLPETAVLNGARVQNLADGDIFLVITNGKNRMPSLSEQLSPGETWDIVNYVRSLSAVTAE